jgi:uncharacterized protein (TIGR03435 family)
LDDGVDARSYATRCRSKILEPTTRHVAVLGIAVVLTVATNSPAGAQQHLGDEPLKAFESQSVHTSHLAADKKLDVETRTGNFTASNVSLADLVAFAYDVRIDQIVGIPAWAGAPRYDVQGRAPKELAGRNAQLLVEDVRPLVAGLLLDFFSLEAHRSESPIYYVLEPAAGGVLLRASADQRAAPGLLAPRGAGLAGERVSIGNLVTELELLVGRTVLNQTFLYQLYDIDLRWDTRQRDPKKLAAEIERQLGLKLRVVQFELLMVDRATELEGDGNRGLVFPRSGVSH